jgi:hypothetical protein
MYELTLVTKTNWSPSWLKPHIGGVDCRGRGAADKVEELSITYIIDMTIYNMTHDIPPTGAPCCAERERRENNKYINIMYKRDCSNCSHSITSSDLHILLLLIRLLYW